MADSSTGWLGGAAGRRWQAAAAAAAVCFVVYGAEAGLLASVLGGEPKQ